MFIGLFFIVIGAIALLKNLGIITFQGGFWSVLYPFIFILIGFYMVLAARKGKRRWNWVKKQFQDDSVQDQ